MKIFNLQSEKVFLFVATLVLIIYKFFWGAIAASWREDESTVIWIADNITLINTPLGLVSSVGLPNPNLLIIFSKIFTIFDSLISVSLFITFLNITLIFFALKNKENDYKNILLFLLMGFSTYISQHTIEPWGQSFLITTNSLFLYFLFRFSINKQYYLFPLFPVIVMIPSGVYLAGLTNTAVYAIFFLIFTLFNIKNVKYFFSNKYINLISISSLFLIVRFTWIPFFNKVDLNSISKIGNSSNDILLIFIERYKNTVKSLFGFWIDERSYYFPTTNINVISSSTNDLFQVFLKFHWFLQRYALLNIVLIFILLIFFKKMLDMDYVNKIFILIFYLFLFTSISPAIGGREFLKYQRMDNYIETYFIFLYIWFFIGYCYKNYKISRLLSYFNSFLIMIFVLFNLFFSYNILLDNYQSESSVLSESDVPMLYKQQVTEYIANDWSETEEGNKIPIFYDLGGGIYDWVNDFGTYMSPYYPSNPYTIGRGFDYILKKKYDLSNSQEGKQFRNIGEAKYVVSYIFSTGNNEIYSKYENMYFGKLRLSINKNFNSSILENK
tara:strand:- start:2487 stop:4151 length:1665 start_codon:yes stop_codon:yes gene_type:complete